MTTQETLGHIDPETVRSLVEAATEADQQGTLDTVADDLNDALHAAGVPLDVQTQEEVEVKSQVETAEERYSRQLQALTSILFPKEGNESDHGAEQIKVADKLLRADINLSMVTNDVRTVEERGRKYYAAMARRLAVTAVSRGAKPTRR